MALVPIVQAGGSNVMAPNTLKYGVPLVFVVLVLASPATAEDKKEDRPAPSGTWTMKGGEAKIEFLDKKGLKIAPHGDKVEIVIACDYTVDKDGVIKAKITGFEGKDEVKK